MSLLKKLNQRASPKMFSDKKIDEGTVDEIIEACNMTPTSMGLQLTRTIIIESDKWKEKLHPHTYYQPQVKSCSHLVVILTKKIKWGLEVSKYLESLKTIRGVTDSEHLQKVHRIMSDFLIGKDKSNSYFTWAENQSYITLGNLITYATNEGIDTCPIEGFSKEGYDKELKDYIGDYTASVVCAMGYTSHKDERSKYKKVRIGNGEYNLQIL